MRGLPPYGHGYFAVHPIPPRLEGRDPARRRPLPPATQDREHVRPIEGLAARLNQIRPMPDPVPLGMRAGSNGHLLVMSLKPSRSGENQAFSQTFPKASGHCSGVSYSHLIYETT